MNLNDFHFLRPWWLLALPLGLLLLARMKKQEPGKNQWHKVCDPHLLEQLLVGEAQTARKRVFSGLLLMLALATLALAGPAWERLPQPLFRAASGRVIVLDLSLSMLSPDIAPSRLSRARFKAIDLIKAGRGLEQGLVVFAGDSFIVTPLTDDHATLLNLLPGLDSNTVPVQGSRADRGLEKAGTLLKQAGINQGQIILIADDADQQTVTAAAKLKSAGYKVDVIAVGTETGAPVAMADGGYLKDNQGQIVVPVPNFDNLRQTAGSGGGRYLTIDAPESSFKNLNQTAALFPDNKSKSELTGDQWLDRGPWLLLPLLFIAAICFRKGWLLIILIALFINPETASAQNWNKLWQGLWQRPTQQAAKAFARKDYKKAAEMSKDPDWQAAANYRAGNFQEAASALESLNSGRTHYNRGNALAQAGELEEALKAYDQALQLDPNLEDAKYNRDLVKKLRQQQQNQQESQNGDSEQEERKKEEQNSQESQDESKDQQQSEPSQDSSEQKEPQDNQQSSENQKQNSQTPNQEPQEAQKKPESEAQEPEETHDQAQEKAPPDSAKEEAPKEAKGLTPEEENDEKPMDAKQQALEQWLRRVPDDPQGLLQRKFLYQYRDREDRSQGHKGW